MCIWETETKFKKIAAQTQQLLNTEQNENKNRWSLGFLITILLKPKRGVGGAGLGEAPEIQWAVQWEPSECGEKVNRRKAVQICKYPIQTQLHFSCNWG